MEPEIGAVGLSIRAGPVLTCSIKTKNDSNGQQILTYLAGKV